MTSGTASFVRSGLRTGPGGAAGARAREVCSYRAYVSQSRPKLPANRPGRGTISTGCGAGSFPPRSPRQGLQFRRALPVAACRDAVEFDPGSGSNPSYASRVYEGARRGRRSNRAAQAVADRPERSPCHKRARHRSGRVIFDVFRPRDPGWPPEAFAREESSRYGEAAADG